MWDIGRIIERRILMDCLYGFEVIKNDDKINREEGK